VIPSMQMNKDRYYTTEQHFHQIVFLYYMYDFSHIMQPQLFVRPKVPNTSKTTKSIVGIGVYVRLLRIPLYLSSFIKVHFLIIIQTNTSA